MRLSACNSVDRLYAKQYKVEDKKNLIIRWASQSSNTGIPNKYPTMQIWKPILASCTDGHLLTLSVILSLNLFSPPRRVNRIDAL